MSRAINWRVFIAVAAVLAGLAYAASWFLRVPFLPTFGILIAALLINGFIATLEDDLPEGFNNPDGKRTPPVAGSGVLIAKWTAALLLCAFGVAFALAGTASDADSPIAFVAGISLACILLALALLAKWRWALWAALATAVLGIGVAAVVH
jgi:hypothetical protein